MCISSRKSEGEVGEPSSQIAMLTRALREKEREVEEITHELMEKSIKVSSITGSRVIVPIGVYSVYLC